VGFIINFETVTFCCLEDHLQEMGWGGGIHVKARDVTLLQYIQEIKQLYSLEIYKFNVRG
jgi:hypothetical protein